MTAPPGASAGKAPAAGAMTQGKPQAPPPQSAARPAAAPPKAAPAPPTPALPASQKPFSVWWIIVPTLLFAIVVRDIPQTLALAAIGAGLHFAQTRPEVPATVKPYLPLLQSLIVFIFLGGSLILVALVAGAGVAAFKWYREIFAALEPWWQLQQRMPLNIRRVLAFLLSLWIGYNFGVQASGSEWTYTLLSIVAATIVTFLLIFTPPRALRGSA